MPHICVSESGQHWFRQWLVAFSAPSHYLNQCCVIVNWTLGKKLLGKFNQNIKLSIHENASENIVCERADILSRGRWVEHLPWTSIEECIPRFCLWSGNNHWSRERKFWYGELHYSAIIKKTVLIIFRKRYLIQTKYCNWRTLPNTMSIRFHRCSYL